MTTPAKPIVPADDGDLELVCYGESYAWLQSSDRAEPEDALYVITEQGRDAVRRAAAMRALFGQPWPKVSEARP